MARNVEFKARVEALRAVADLAARIGDAPGELLRQRDTYYRVPHGRAKLRQISAADGTRTSELIIYRREDEARARVSRYLRLVPLEEPGAAAGSPSEERNTTEDILGDVMEVVGVVSKERTVIMVGQTRIHLDRVDGLGEFVELEVVLKPDQSEADGRKVAEDLMNVLGLNPGMIEPRSYIDLICDINSSGEAAYASRN